MKRVIRLSRHATLWMVAVVVLGGAGMPAVLSKEEAAQNDKTFDRLEQPITMDVRDMPLGDAVKAWAAAANLEVSILPETSFIGHVTIKTEKGASANAALKAMLTQMGTGEIVTFAVSKGKVVVGKAGAFYKMDYVTTRSYDVLDLLTAEAPTQARLNPAALKKGAGPGGVRDSAVGALEDVVKSIVYPEKWNDRGGTLGEIRTTGNTMLIMQLETAHREIRDLLANFRRKESQAGSDADKTVTLEKKDGAFAELVQNAADAAGLDIFVDALFLQMAGIDANKKVSQPALAKAPLHEVLTGLLKQMDVKGSCRCTQIDRLLVITTREIAQSRPFQTVEVYDVGDLLKKAKDGPALLAMRKELLDGMKNKAVPTSWFDVGGTIGNARMFGNKLAVLQNDEGQRAVADYLKKLRAPAGK